MLVCWDEGGRRNSLFVWHNEKEIRCFYWWERSIKSCEMCGFASAVHLVSKHRTLTLRHTVLLSLSVFSLFWPLKTFQMMCKLYQCSQNSVFSSFTLYWPQLVPTRLAFLSTLQNLCIQCNTVFSCRLNCLYFQCLIIYLQDITEATVHTHCQYIHTRPYSPGLIHLVAHWLRENQYIKVLHHFMQFSAK